MQMNLMELIKEGSIGTTMKSRGGIRYKWCRFVFVKVKKNTVHCYCGNGYRVISDQMQKHDVSSVVCTLTPENITFNLKRIQIDKTSPWYNGNKYRIHNKYMFNGMDAFLSLNLLYDCYTKWSSGAELIHSNNKGLVFPYSKMVFDWSGALITDTPAHALKSFKLWDRARKDKINRQARARYAQAAAEREFRKYEKQGKLDEYPPENVFTIQNAQLRSYAINAIGLEKILAPYPTKVVDTETIKGQGKYELIDVEIPGINVYAWGRETKSQPKWCLYLKMINQSTGEYHLEGVPRESDNSWNCIPEETVRGALAWRDGEVKEKQWHGGNKIEQSEWKYIEPATLT